MFDNLHGVNHKVILSVSKVLDPSKSPLKRETLIPVPLVKGVIAVFGRIKYNRGRGFPAPTHVLIVLLRYIFVYIYNRHLVEINVDTFHRNMD